MPRPAMLRRLATLAVLALTLTVAGATGAHAHAVLLEASPPDGARLAGAPAELVLRFNEPVVPQAIRLLDRDGNEAGDVVVTPRGDSVVLRPTRSLPDGVYLLSYRVASLDAHPVAATLRFGIGVDPGAGSESTDEFTPAAWLAASGRWLVYLTALAAAGATLFELLVRPPPLLAVRVRRFAAWAAACGILALAWRIGTAGLELGGLPLDALASPAPWRLAAATTLGPAALLAALGLSGIATGFPVPVPIRLAAVAAVAGSFALTGHAASAAPYWLTGPALGVHVLCAAFWLGSLVPLLCCLQLDRHAAAAVLRRFSAMAAAAVALLAAAGGALAWVQLGGDPRTLVTTTYGWRLASKLALVLGLLALAACNRQVLTPALARGDQDAGRWLGRSLCADLALGVLVLAVTATFPLSPPPRALMAVAAEPEGRTLVIATPAGQATLSLLPGRAGSNRLEAQIMDGNGEPILAREGSIAWSLAAAGIERQQAALVLPAAGVATATGLALPRGGRWQLRLELLIDDFTKLIFAGQIDVP